MEVPDLNTVFPLLGYGFLIIGWGSVALLFLIGSRGARQVLGYMVLYTFLLPWLQAPSNSSRVVMVVLILVIGLVILQWLASAVIGKRAADSMVGSLAADLIRSVFKLPFVVVRLILYIITYPLHNKNKKGM